MSSTLAKGWRSWRAAAVSAVVLTPMPRSISTFLPERVGVCGRDDVHEPGVREHGRAAHDLGPVLEDREAGERQARVPLVRVVHADERARATRGAVGERRLLAEHDTAHTPRGQRVCDAHAVDSTSDNDDVGRPGHAEYLIMC